MDGWTDTQTNIQTDKKGRTYTQTDRKIDSLTLNIIYVDIYILTRKIYLALGPEPDCCPGYSSLEGSGPAIPTCITNKENQFCMCQTELILHSSSIELFHLN